MNLEFDSPDWFQDIANRLAAKGLTASADHMGGGIICIAVELPGFLLYFGTANEVWGADVYVGEFGNLEEGVDDPVQNIPCSSESDTLAAADAIYAAVQDFISRRVKL